MLDNTYNDTWNTREQRLKELGTTYKEFLQSAYWLDVKRKAQSRAAYNCCKVCGSTSDIDLHHTSYKWLGTKDELRCVIPLCREHHEKVHNLAKTKQISVRLASNTLVNEALANRLLT